MAHGVAEGTPAGRRGRCSGTIIDIMLTLLTEVVFILAMMIERYGIAVSPPKEKRARARLVKRPVAWWRR